MFSDDTERSSVGTPSDEIPTDLEATKMLDDTKPRHTNAQPVRPRVAIAMAVGLLIVAAFQAALTFGAPLGAAAQGGTNLGQLPDPLRLVTGLSTIVWVFAALLVLARGGCPVVPLPEAVSRVGAWVLVGLLGTGALLNLASSSPWERFGWAPFTLVLLILGVLLARSGAAPGRPVPAAAPVGQWGSSE